ncbi:MAG TPA: NAD-dependent epimerase/dehydratase family protein [Longimicrobiales bacterium]|nr:NAD-dependent epimerase/dehydratase family protein [Longimicrobiales bacterium]
MPTTRRDFLHLAAAATGAAAVNGLVPQSVSAALPSPLRADRAPRALRILILGGTGFTGPHQVHYAIDRGHHVTVFNRGRSQADLPAAVVHLQGDRNAPDGLAALEREVANGTKWDVVIDNPTTLPFWVRDAGRVLGDATQHYVFISTISVYADTSRAGMDETTELAAYTGADALAETMQTYQASRGGLYGPLKAASEREAEKWFPGRTTVIRPGLIVGPRDMSGRFTYWPVRIARGGEVLAPGTGHDAVQVIDARDLAEWTIRMAETRTFGTYNATGPAGELTIAEMLGGIRGAFDGTTKMNLTWVPADFLAEQSIRGWSHMPVWVAPRDDNAGFSRVSIERALNTGLTFRPLAMTARDTLEWFRSLPSDVQARVGGPLAAEREAEVLRAWHARPGA